MKKHFLTLSAADLFDLAIGVEDSNMRRYRVWADRFRPFNGAVSDLFDDMAEDSQRDGMSFRSSQPSSTAGSIETSFPNGGARTENVTEMAEHFFVVNKAMARCILKAAVNSLSRLRYFYKSILVMTENAFLRQACVPRTLIDIGYSGRLNRFLEQY